MRLALPTPPSRSITLLPGALCYYSSGTRICGGWRGQVHYLALGEIPGGPRGADQAVRGDHLQRVEGRQCLKASPYLLSLSGSNPLLRLPLYMALAQLIVVGK
jgi:hypothetical protein